MINFLYGTNTLSAYLIPYKSGLDKAKPIITLVLIISASKGSSKLITRLMRVVH